jgi:hypothetical protein
MYEQRLPDPRMIPVWSTQGRPEAVESESKPTMQSDSEVDGTVVRPFIVSGGRTRPLQDNLRIETLVSAPPALLSAPLNFENRRIAQLCQTPRSIAEIAVTLGVPIGVAKVLVADLVMARAVICHQPTDTSTRTALERIRDLVRAL